MIVPEIEEVLLQIP